MIANWTRRIRLVWAVALLATLCAISGPVAAQETFAPSSLLIETAGGGKYRFKVEIAATPAQQSQGLMQRSAMAMDAGMLFTYAAAQPTAFWMKNTLIPLDMLFIAADGRISHIHPNATPHSEASIPSRGPVKGVLEINGGLAALLGIRIGDTVRHENFGNGG